MMGIRGVITIKSELLAGANARLSKAAPTCAGQYRAGGFNPPEASRTDEIRAAQFGQSLLAKGFPSHESVASRITRFRQPTSIATQHFSWSAGNASLTN